MRIALSISLLVLLSFQVMLKTILVLNYSVNKAYIAANLCVNKAKPAMRCEGKCHLKKKINQAEDAESKTIPSSIKKLEVSYCLSYFELNPTEIIIFILSDAHGLPEQQPVVSISNTIFHPPQAVA